MDSMALDRLLEPICFPDGRALQSGLIPGPMDSVTEGSFVRVLSSHHYVSCWHMPFIRISTGVPSCGKLASKLAPFLDTGLPVITQIMGAHPGRLGETAARLHQLGTTCVDLNCGCPSPTVVGNGSGGARLRDLPWLKETLQELRKSCGRHGLSVKVRMGFDSPAEFEGIAQVLRDSGVDMITVHYRTVREMYGPVEQGLDRLKHAVELLPGIPVIGSGDLFTVEDCIRMVEQTGVRGLAPARGLMRDPRLLTKVRARLEGDKEPEPWNELDYLLELATECQRNGGASNGFILRIVHSMFGKDSQLFQQLADCRTLARTRDFLQDCKQHGIKPMGRQ